MVHKTVAGVLPDEWRGSLIKHVCKVVRGSSPRPAGSPLYFNGNFLPWATVADLTCSDDMYLTSTKSMLTEAGSERTRITDPGTLMLTNSGATLGVPKISSIRCGANDGIAMLLDLDGIATEFAYYYLYSKTQYFRVVIAPGVGQPNLNTELIGDFPIPVPPLPEQKKIAQILSTWDKAITTTEQLLANSQQQKKALMHQLLTGKNRLLDNNGVRFSGEWKTHKFGNLFKERVETGRDDLPLLSITADDGVVYQEDTGRKNTSNEDKSKYRRICVNDIGYNTMRMWQGRSSLSDKEGIVSPAYTIVTPTDKVCPVYAAYLFKLPALVYVFYRHSQGLVSDTWNLKFNHFKKIGWQLPSIDEQQKIAAVISTADQEISALQQKLDALKQEKKALMQQLLTGKRRVLVS
ncbi:type I restriction enzyme, S subunit [Pseudidiomarina maritima]|uniref:Type I restriction enzyme, S subunit n=1 Tax=Pseudidiomarina maritima TaxID=519453 RepID=A0A1I6H885_9GAMM|nr:restriction endonuclease subunit S [Pseudidiomarina maritima]SFR50561.1 type I restriction enzyme, S subunit [Pseudidiomarina maritima]